MRSLKKGKPWLRSEWVWIPLSLAITLTFFFVAIKDTAYFITDDDRRMMYVLAGYLTGKPMAVYSFINVILGEVVAGFYRLIPSVAWYTVLQYTAILYGSAAVGRSIYKLCDRRNIPILLGVVFQVCSLILLFSYTMGHLHFHTTSGYWGIAALAILLGIEPDRDSRRKQVVQFSLSVLSILMCALQDEDTAYCLLCFYLLAIAYHMVCSFMVEGKSVKIKELRLQDKKRFVYSAASAACALVLIFASFAIDQKVKTDANAYYQEYDRYRVSYWDYYDGTYESNEEAMEAAGWSESFFDLTQRGYFMDESFSIQALERIVGSYSRFSRTVAQVSYADAIKTCVSVLSEYSAIMIMAFCVVCAVCLLLFCSRRDGIVELLTGIACGLGCAILMLYLAFRGRFPLHAFHVVALPTATFLLLLTIRCLPVFPGLRNIGRNLKLFMLAFLCLLGVVNLYTLYRLSFSCDQIESVSQNHVREELVSGMENYVSKHPENVYVYDVTLRPSGSTKPLDDSCRVNNSIQWGNSYMYSPAYYEQLKSLGRASLHSDAFMEEDVYFLTAIGTVSTVYWNADMLLAYLAERYGAIGYDVISAIPILDGSSEPIDVFAVISFQRRDAGQIEGKSGFVSSNGITYYADNGVPRVGFFEVNGETYYGLPALPSDSLENVSDYFKRVYAVGQDGSNAAEPASSGEPTAQWEGKRLQSARYDAGMLATGSVMIDGDRYLFSREGVMLKNSWA